MDENQIIVDAWDTILFDKFSRFKHLLVDGLSAHSNEVFSRDMYQPGQRVLDVGCGFGDSTLRIAQQVAPDGLAVGADCAENFVREARAAAETRKTRNAQFLVADVQRDDLHGPYDAVFARFGTMFFALPGAAMANIRRALKPGGEFTQIVWRKREDNTWLYEAEMCVRELVPVVSHDETDQVHCGPGPFSMSGPDMVSSMLRSVGFDRIRFERFDADICIGHSIDEAVEFAMALGPAGEIIRLAGEEGERRLPQVREALGEVFRPYLRNGEVWGPSSTWFITARNPAA
ncbi:MAG: class I SAM-dependent methyltransferase [Pseudomonadota bacterium]|nr:class I SAM-dependent methyltransferase [Pseudomonadota bacterium]